MHHLRIERAGNPDDNATISRSLQPEAEDLGDDRSSTTIAVTSDTLTIDIWARDLVALRAAANTWLGLLRTAENVLPTS